MSLDCLLVTCDPALLAQIKAAFSAKAVSLDLRQDSASAIELTGRRHLDGLVIDCDDIAGGKEALAKARQSPSNKDTLIIAVVKGQAGSAEALDLGANFVLWKPIQETRLRSVLETAMARMECEHRRYFRYTVDLPVRLRDQLEQSVLAKMKNISEGGLAVRLPDPVHLKGIAAVEFDIPSVEPQIFRAKANVVWSDSFEMGLRFMYIEKVSESGLQSWLSLLEAQARLRESTTLPC